MTIEAGAGTKSSGATVARLDQARPGGTCAQKIGAARQFHVKHERLPPTRH
jgi:hypothetical protein